MSRAANISKLVVEYLIAGALAVADKEGLLTAPPGTQAHWKGSQCWQRLPSCQVHSVLHGTIFCNKILLAHPI